MKYEELGKIVLKLVGEQSCQEGYLTTDPYWVGRYALGYGDVDEEGNLT